jgi:hypothetical protein
VVNRTLEVGGVACPVNDSDMKTMDSLDCSRFFLGLFSFREDGQTERRENRGCDVEGTNWWHM